MKKGIYDNCLKSVRVKGGNKDFKVDKLKVANEITNNTIDMDILDLKENIDKVVKFIRSSNDFFNETN